MAGTGGRAVMIVVRATSDPSMAGLVRTSVRRYETGAEDANAPPTDNVENVGVGDALSLVRAWLEDLAHGDGPPSQ
jgi:hypothetical protein